MTLENINYIAQTIGVLAILISLVAIFFQMRQGQVLGRADSQRDLLKSVGGFLQITLDNPRILNDIRLGLQVYDSAPVETRNNFSIWAWALLHCMEQCVYMKADGLISEDTYNGFETGMLSIIVTPGGAQWWAHTKKVFNAMVGAHLDRRLAERGGATPPIWELLTQFAPVEEAASMREQTVRN